MKTRACIGVGLVALGLVLTGCARESAPAKSPGVIEPGSSKPSASAYQRGIASYYADSLAGRKTASGEPYDPKAMTAAHRKLPFGTVVEVRAKNGRSVTVRINDRGPFGRGRVIDLSRRAAERLGMIRAGIVDVELRIVSSPPVRRRRR